MSGQLALWFLGFILCLTMLPEFLGAAYKKGNKKHLALNYIVSMVWFLIPVIIIAWMIVLIAEQILKAVRG